jgi:hypothetical protein
VYEFVPVATVAHFHEGSCLDADVEGADCVAEDQLVVDEFLNQLGLLRLPEVLIDRDLEGLHEVKVLSFDLHPQHLSRRVRAESLEVQPPQLFTVTLHSH